MTASVLGNSRLSGGSDGGSKAGETAISLRGISKRYGGVQALQDVTFDIELGTVVGLVGDNGAGKSTLVRIIAGVEQPTSGTLEVGTAHNTVSGPVDASERGISVVYQDLALALQQDVSANVFLGREILVKHWLGRHLGWLDRREMRTRTAAALAELHTKIPDLNARCQDLSGGQRQALAIARAVMWCDRLLVLDEPTSALGVEQQREVLDLVRRVRDLGVAVLFVSHQMADVQSVCDHVVVLRRGQLVARLSDREIDSDSLIRHITGAEPKQPLAARPGGPRPEQSTDAGGSVVASTERTTES